MNSVTEKVDNVVLVTTTFYTKVDDLRCKLAFQMVEEAVKAGYPLVIVDGSPIKEVTEKLKELGAQVFPELHRGMGPSRRQVYSHAIEVLKGLGSKKERIIVWLEPEKYDLIQYIPKIIHPLIKGDCDIVIPFRTERSWKSYPEFQQTSEQEGNRMVAKLYNRKDLDVFFGPVASNTRGTQLVVVSDPKGHGIADTYVPQYLASYALITGLKVGSVSVDFIYPAAQKEAEEKILGEEMREKRKQQLATVTKAHEVIMLNNSLNSSK